MARSTRKLITEGPHIGTNRFSILCALAALGTYSPEEVYGFRPSLIAKVGFVLFPEDRLFQMPDEMYLPSSAGVQSKLSDMDWMRAYIQVSEKPGEGRILRYKLNARGKTWVRKRYQVPPHEEFVHRWADAQRELTLGDSP